MISQRRRVNYYYMNQRISGGLTPTLSLDFSSGIPSILVGNGASGLAQKLDLTYQSFTSPAVRRTDRGVVFEPASKNCILPSTPDNVTGYSLTNSFTAINDKTSVIPGSTAKEFVANTTTAILTAATNAAQAGSYGSSRECMWVILETTPTSSACYLQMEDATNGGVVMLALNLGGLQNAQPSLGSAVAGTTGQLWGSLNIGTGPNGGRLWLFMTSGVPITTGGTRKFRIRPNGSAAPTSGWSTIIHHVQHEVNSWPTSPIFNSGSVTANSRSAESFTAPLVNGTYNVRYYLQDGTHVDRLGVVVSDGNFHVATDVTQKPAIDTQNIPGATVQLDQRIGYISKIEAWPQYPDFFILGDSFAGTPTSMWTPYFARVPRNFANSSTFGGSTTQEADNWDGLSSHWGDTLMIMDGGLTAGETPSTYLASIARIVARLTSNPKKWLFIETCPGGVDGNEIGSSWYNNYAASMAAVKAAYPNNFVPTLALMQTHGNGGATDNTDIANGFWPRSLQLDRLHPNNLGSIYLNSIMAVALDAKAW